jgi:hypothetical protein
MGNYLVFQAYGPAEIINQCKFFLLRFAAKANDWDRENIKIVIYTTDESSFYGWKAVLPNIMFEPVTMKQITEWRGAINFVHRVKIEIITHFFSKYGGNMLYCDTDTYPLLPLQALFTGIDNGKIYMHTCEGKIEYIGQFKKWHLFLQKNKQLDFLSGVNIKCSMWNAGVIGFSDAYKSILSGVAELTDNVYPLFKKHTVEQFVFSYFLQQQQEVNAAENYIYHYWDLKEFGVILNSWFLNNREKSFAELIESSTHISPEEIMLEKTRYYSNTWPAKLYKKLRGKNWKIENYVPG